MLVSKEVEMSVRDASLRWFFQLTTSAALNCVDMFPAYRQLVIGQAKEAFKHIKPMALCQGSSERPKFLSKPILSEIHSFLQSLTRNESDELSDDILLCKIKYSLAACDLASIISVLSYLLDNPERSIDTEQLISSMQTVRTKFWTKGERSLSLNYVDCDGGEKQAESADCIHPRELIAYDSSVHSEDAYTAKKGKTKFSLILEAAESIQITRLTVRPAKGDKGVGCGLLFLLPLSEVVSSKSEEKSPPTLLKSKSSLSAEDQKALYKRLEKYDDWTKADYEAHKKEEDGKSAKADGLLCFFSVPEDPNDWDEIDLPIGEQVRGHVVVVKFLRPRSHQSEKIGVIGLNLFGYTRTSDYFLDIDFPAANCTLKASELCHTILSFLIVVIKSLENRLSSEAKLPLVDFSRLSVSLITEFFQKIQSYKDMVLMRKVLRVCHCIFLNWAPGKDEKDSGLLFETFSSIINCPEELDQSVLSVARSVIVDGAKAFFPNDEMRKNQLLRMLKGINKADELPSTGLVFESLCQFFSDVEPSALLNLPTPGECIKSAETLQGVTESCFEIIDTLICVTLHKALASTSKSSQSGKSLETLSMLPSGVAHPVLVKLLSCLQTGFLVWINSAKSTGNKELKEKCEQLLLAYLKMAVGHCMTFTDFFLELPDTQNSTLFNMEDDLVFSTLKQMVVYLSEYCRSASAEHNMDILEVLWPFVQKMKTLHLKLPDHFPLLESDHWSSVSTDIEVINTWTEESPHNYANNQNITKTFNSPGAKYFIIEFDSRCHTERKYDYLEFSNTTGTTHKFDQKVGSDSWPLRLEIKGNKLKFLFHSDQSNNEWGYKFTVTAKGIPDTPVSQVFDFHLSLSLLLGDVCGRTLGMPMKVESTPSLDVQADNEAVMLKSTLWKTLFRAGYQPTDRLERSLSGRFMHGCYDKVKGYLLELLNDHTAEPYKSLLAHLQSRCKHYQKVGIPEITSAILHTFAAFVYHTNDVCESLAEYINNEQTESLVDGIYQAYNLAEQMRLPLISLRQKVLEKGEPNSFTLPQEMIDKANLLLKFAALTKAPTFDRYPKTMKPRKASARRPGDSDLLKRLEGSIPEKYGQFHLVLEFIIDTMLFLRAVLGSQKAFPVHYADAVDGCGLQQESKLRMHYYSLVRLLVNAVQSFPGEVQGKNHAAACSVIHTCLLHLLDMDWRENDYVFLKEINLPHVLFTAAKNSVAVRERVEHPTDEAEEMASYDRDKKYYSECSDAFSSWFHDGGSSRNKQEVQMFIARHCDLLDVEIFCDGCTQTLPGKRYRCLQCTDMDLCVTCFTSGVCPLGDHKEDHTFVYLMYKCDVCQAFISGERVHCKQCEDFDLCYGCHKNKKTLASHNADHEVIKFPQIRLKSASNTSHMSSYIHQHAWLQFTQLTLALAGAVFETDSSKSLGSPGEEYGETATHLLTSCLSLITGCLQKVSFSSKAISTVEYKEEMFVQNSQERIMGLLGSILSLEEQYDTELSTVMNTTDFLHFIFHVGSGYGGYGQHSAAQHLALGLLTQLMQKSSISTKETDEAVLRTQKKPLSELEDEESGLATVEFIVNAASTCLEKHQGVDWSCSLVRLLQQLIHTPHWSPIIKQYLVDTTSQLVQSMSLDLVLCLFTICGFPQIKSPGVNIKYLDASQELRKAVILKHFPDKMQSMVVDTASRRKKMIKDQVIEHCSVTAQLYDDNLLSVITKIIIDNTSKLVKGSLLDMETHWVLSLCLKTLDQFVSSHVPYENLDVIRSLVNLAGMGTRLSKLWLSADLEVLSLMLYIKLGANPGAVGGGSGIPTPVKSTKPAASAQTDALDSFPDMDVDSRKHFKVLLEMLNVPVSQLKQVYNDHRESPSLLLQALHGLVLEDTPEKSKHSLKGKSASTSNDKQEIGERMIDFGILATAITSSSDLEDMEPLEAVEEEKVENNSKKNLQSSGFPMAETDEKKSSSAKLLKSELSNILQKSPSHMQLNKVNLGLSILYARQALGTILSNWSIKGPRITAQLLNCEEHNLVLVLDVLNRDSSNLKLFEQVVSKVMSCCSEDYLQSVAEAASYFMEERKSKQVMRESPHQKHKKVKGEVSVAGASVILVSFDKCCNTSVESSLDIATSPDMKSHHHRFCGPNYKWQDIELPGNKLYFTYQPAGSGSNKWKFTVNSAANNSHGSFFTGFVILNHILSTPSYCRIIDSATLWRRLVVVACKQKGPQRLKVIQLLLYLLKSHSKTEGDGCGPTELKLDLRYLAPLWRLYFNMSEDHGPEQASDLLRALTELFVEAETVALEWGVDGEFLSCMIDPKHLLKPFQAGVRRVLALATAIGLDSELSGETRKD
ncbi:hypothetical protein EB796_011992 [Bugula neritina]|uniref:ZZ-type domain-containing protein n=1 Tax=Bugula neritina TaxID=10212 RepID=A0A7J7JVC5_BUGNE|nr:hypothetical protein EB796_011992 [Bugula neritina]